MEPVKAIVLTCDRYRAFTDHMIFKYAQLWPNHPFHFRVPYQELSPTMGSNKVEYKKSPIDIKSAVLALLDDLADDELIYWCIDDKYPVKLDVPRIEKMYQWLVKDNSSAIDGLLFCRCRRLLESNYLTGETVIDDLSDVYLERKGYDQIWIHQFLQVKVLRYLFESFPDIIPFAKYMDVLKSRVKKPPSHRIFVSQRNFAVFGESTTQGRVTLNCYKSIIENGLALPPGHIKATPKKIFIGAEYAT